MAKREFIDKYELDYITVTTDDYSGNEILDVVLKEDIDIAPSITEQDIVKPYLTNLADKVNRLHKVGYDGKVYVSINDVFDLIDSLISEEK